MYGYQGNNSQPYNYQNPTGSSYGNIGQYTGPYHSYYSNASTAYNSFPSNDQPCSSLGVLPQEYSQVGNGIPRPYYFDSNNSYPRPYQTLPYNQSVDLQIANSYNSCPRNCHCCESINPKYFAASNSLQQQTNTQNSCDSSLNSSYNGFRKGIGSGRWREGSQLQNIPETNDSSSTWPMAKYGTSCKTEPFMWPLSQKQPTKFENTEHLATGNAYMLPQQHQRKPIPNNQAYSVLHSNSLLPVQTSRATQGRTEELMTNCFSAYPCSSDYKKSIPEHAPYSKPQINKINPPSRPTYNLSSNCEGGFSYKFSSANANIYHENQKCAIDPPKLVSQLSSTLVESIQRRLPGSNILDGANEMSYCQSSLITSVHSIDAPTRRTYSIPTEGDPRILLNCGSSASNDVLPTSRLPLPPIHSLKPTGIVMNGPPKDFCDEFSYNPPRSSIKSSLDNGYRIPSARNVALPNVSMRNISPMSHEKVPVVPSENPCRIESEMGNSYPLTNFIPNNRYAGKQFYLEQSSEFTEVDKKLNVCKDMPVKPMQSMSGNPVVGDLRHFLSTWDDGDDEESSSVAPSVLPLGNDCTQEQLGREHDLPEECASVGHLQKTGDACIDGCGNSTNYVVEPKQMPVAYECANSYKVFNSSSENNSFHAHANSITSVAIADVGEIGIQPKTGSELEPCAKKTALMSKINALHSDADQRSQETYNQSGLCPRSNSSPHGMVANISEKRESRTTPHAENLNIPPGSVDDGGEASSSQSGRRNVIISEIQKSTSHAFPSEVMNEASMKEKEGEAPHHSLDGIVGSMEESSSFRTVEREVSCCEDSESPNKLLTENGEDNTVPEAVGSTAISTSSSRSPKATYALNDALSCDHNPENYLSPEKSEYSSLIWSNSKAKECIFEPRDNFVGNCPKLQETHVEIKEVDIGQDVSGEIAMNQNLRAEKCNDDCSPHDKCELGIKESILKDITCNVDEHVSIPLDEMNNFLPPQNNSKHPSEEGLVAFKENSNASSKEDLISLSQVEITAQEESLNKEAYISPQRNAFGGIFNCLGVNQEQSELDSVQFPESQVHEVEIMNRDNRKLALNQSEGTSFKSVCRKSIMDASRVVKKSSAIAAIQIRRKYNMIRLKNQRRLRLSEIRNKACVARKSTDRSMVEKTRNVHLIGKTLVGNHSENQSNKRKSPKNIYSKEHQITYSKDKNEPERGPVGVTSNNDAGGESLKDVDFLKSEDDELKKNEEECTIHSGQIRLLEEEDTVEYHEIENVDEIASGENDVSELLSMEEREAQLVNYEGNCVIGNVEVFMGNLEVAHTFEDAVEAAHVENVLHEAPSIQEEANLQYWCNYELGNDLGVAMEIEVGSEIYSSDSVELKQQVEEGALSCSAMNERVGDSIEGEAPDYQGREKILVNSSDVLNNAKTINARNEQSTVNEGHFSTKVYDKEDPCMCRQKQENIENGALNFNNKIADNLNDCHPAKISVAQRITLDDNTHTLAEDNICQSEDIISKKVEADVVGKCSQEVKDVIVDPYPEFHSASNINKGVMPEINCTQENSEQMEDSDQESKHILSVKSKLKTSSQTKDHKPFHKRFKKCVKNIISSACNSNDRDLIKSHSNQDSSKELQAGETIVINTVSSNDTHSEDGPMSIPKPPHDSATISEKGEGMIILEKDVCKNGCMDLEIDKSYETTLAGGNQSQLKLGSKNEDRHSSSQDKAESNQNCGAVNKIARKQSVKMKFIYKSGKIKNPIKEHSVIIHQREPFNKKLLIKTKASLKSFDNKQLKSVISPKFGFWKNRSWYHRRIFRKHLKKSPILQNAYSIPHCAMPQSPKHMLPQILEMCSTPPPKPLSPLPVSEDILYKSGENISIVASGPPCKINSLDNNANENNVSSSNCSLLGVKDHSNNSTSLNPPLNESKFSSSDASETFCQAALDMDCIMTNSVHSKPLSPLPLVAYNEQEITKEEVTKCEGQKEKDAVTDSVFFNTHPVEDTIHEEKKVDSSWSTMNSSVVVINSCSSSESPHVRMSFKKVLNGSKKNMWMNRPIADSLEEKQDIFPPGKSKLAKRMSSTEGESPLPKVTIKKKSGEKGYQSFLSGFSSASSSPSTSPTFLSKSSSPLHLLPNTEKLPTVKCNEGLEGSAINGESTEELHDSLNSSRNNNSCNVPNIEMPSKNSNDEHTFYANVVKKKEGSGLVFVIRGLGGKIRGCSIKDEDAEHKHPSTVEECGLINSNTQEMTACATGGGDEDWELGPWSVWQPVVKLSRSCELDHLALKLQSVHEGGEEKNTHEKFYGCQESPGSEECSKNCKNGTALNPMHHPSQEYSKELDQKGKAFSERDSFKNQSGEIILNRKGPHINFGTNKVEFDMVMRECDRLILPKKKPKSGSKLHSAHKLIAARNTQVLSTERCDVQGTIHVDGKECVYTEQGENKLSTEDASLVEGQVGWTGKNECGNESVADSSILSRANPLNDKIKNAGERTWENSKQESYNEGDKQGMKAKRSVGSESGASDLESAVKLNSEISSLPEMKSVHVPLKNVPDKGWERRTKYKASEEKCVPIEASCIFQEPIKEEEELLQSKSLKCEKESHAGPADRSPYVCEACCRTFSSQKWLSRHCKGVSHSRVENAQRQAVQALLLLLTGNESHLLQPLSEKELSHLKRWSSHAVPSPLQLALSEFLNAT